MRARNSWVLASALALASYSAVAGTDFTDLTPSERKALTQAIQRALKDSPELVAPALDRQPTPLPDLYGAEIRRDLTALERLHKTLGTRPLTTYGQRAKIIAFTMVVSDTCHECAASVGKMKLFAKARGFRFAVITATEIPDAVRALDMNVFPSFVFPKVVFQGSMPPIVMDRYLANGTGQ